LLRCSLAKLKADFKNTDSGSKTALSKGEISFYILAAGIQGGLHSIKSIVNGSPKSFDIFL
jgi:hypothetical protein